ncbi:hypothetical protein ACVWZM_005566 [Bradyrhizobium sp. USDA 4501]
MRGGNPHRPKAYSRAADSLAALAVPLDVLIAEDRLTEIPGVGNAIADIITKLQKTGSHPSLEKLRKEIPTFAFAELKTMPDAIRQGRQVMPPQKASTALVSAAAEPTPEMQTVFMLRSAWFRDEHGQRKFAGQYEDATMPIAAALRALDQCIAVDVTDPRRAQLCGVRGGDFNPQAADVIDLDTIEEPMSATPVELDRVLRDAVFTVIDRSADARTIQIEVPRL